MVVVQTHRRKQLKGEEEEEEEEEEEVEGKRYPLVKHNYVTTGYWSHATLLSIYCIMWI